METNPQVLPKGLIKSRDLDVHFASEVIRHSGVNLNKCFHCQSCAGGCPFHPATDYNPNGVIRLVQLGLKKEALECSTIWICVGCHTCTIQCPQAIDMAAVMDTLRQIAIREGALIAEPDILNFHKDVLHTIKRYGRTHKLEIMLRQKARKWDWFSDLALGIKMFAKRKLHLRPSRIESIDIVRKSFQPKPIRVAYE
ncbi:MAG: 4Fe-4S dicluster domain-containing protein [Proteobacteria bacterium]|nr:4Fe-4S dicluster domain-containing protein [Pseudomonadota bacterium]